MAKHQRSPSSARILFAENMRRERKLRGFSQEELAERADLHRTYIGSVERGERNISIDNIEKIAVALAVDIVLLLADSKGGGPT